MAEDEQAHRIAYEKHGVAATIKEARRGQIFGALLSAFAIGGAVYTAHIGAHWSVSVALVGIPVLGIIQAVIRPRAK